MANKVTSIQNSQGVIIKSKEPASSSDINELQSVINNKLQALSNNIYLEWSLSNSILSINAINLKNKVVANITNVYITLSSQISKIHFLTREVKLTDPSASVYLYGLRSNTQTQISGSDTPTENNLITQPLDEQVSDRLLVEWTMIISDTTPTLPGWIYEGYVLVSKSGSGKGSSNSESSIQYVVDYIVTGTATLEDINSDARNNSLSGRSTVLSLNDVSRDFNIYQWTGSAWKVIQSVAQYDRIILGSDTLTESRTIDPTKRVPSYAFTYNLNDTLNYKVQLLGSSSSESEYTLPPATQSTLGGIKVGANLTITADGTLSGTPDTKYTLPVASSQVLGGVKVGDGLSTTNDGVLSVDTTDLPKASTTQLGVIKVGSNLSIADDGTLNATGSSGEDSPVTSVFGRVGDITAQNGDYNASQITFDETKNLQQVIQEVQQDIQTLETTPIPTASSTTLGGIKVGNGLSITPDGTLSSTGGLSELPIASSTTLGGVKIGNNISVAEDGTITSNQTSVTGNAGTATKLLNPRTIQTNLGSDSAGSFDGTSNISVGVSGTLPISHGGTGATSAANALTALGAASKSEVEDATTVEYTIIVPSSGWVGTEAPYTNTVIVSGITASTVLSDIQLDPSLVGNTDAESANSQWDYLDTQDGQVVFIAKSSKPSTNFTIIARDVK